MHPYLIFILIHFAADFFAQTSEMAVNKSKSFYWLTIHVMTYSIVLAIGMLFLPPMHMDTALLFVYLNASLHWVTDAVTSRCTAYLYRKSVAHPMERVMGDTWMHWFFVMIGLDQVIHYFSLILTYEWLK